jgi:hypothetical protein
MEVPRNGKQNSSGRSSQEALRNSGFYRLALLGLKNRFKMEFDRWVDESAS